MASETACTYACLILQDDGIAITAEKISTLLKAANVNVESYWPSLFAKLCEKKNIEELLLNVGVGAAPAAVSAPVAGDAGAAAAPDVKEKKKEEPKEESEEEGGLFGLFD